MFAKCFKQHIFYLRQRYHFSAHLYKTLKPPLKGKPPFLVHAHKVAGAVPCVSFKFHKGRGGIAKIAFKNTGATHQQHAGLPRRYPPAYRAFFFLHKSQRDRRHGMANGSPHDAARPVDGNHWRAFCNAIALAQSGLWALSGKGAVHVILTLFCPNKGTAQAYQVFRPLRPIQHCPQKSGRRSHERKPIIAHHGRQRASFCGVGVKGRTDSQRKGQNHVDHKPE